MGNWCARGTFGEFPTRRELEITFPDVTVRSAYIAKEVSAKLSTLSVLYVLYWALTTFFFLGLSVVPNYSQIPQGTGFAVPHSIWGVWPSLTILVFTMTFYFGPFFQVSRVVMGSRFFFAVVLFDTLLHAAHFILALVELLEPCESLLCVDSRGYAFLIALTAATGFFVIWNVIIIVVSRGYVNMIVEGLDAGWRPGAVIQSRKQANDILDNAIPDGVNASIAVQMQTPLLQAVARTAASYAVGGDGGGAYAYVSSMMKDE